MLVGQTDLHQQRDNYTEQDVQSHERLAPFKRHAVSHLRFKMNLFVKWDSVGALWWFSVCAVILV